MQWSIEFDSDSGIVYSQMKGFFTPEGLQLHAEETVKAILKHDCRKAFVNLRLFEGGVCLTDIYDLPQTYEKNNLPRNVKIAILFEPGPVKEEDLVFLVSRGLNIGYKIKVFKEESDAITWLST